MYLYHNPKSKYPYQVREIDLDHSIYMDFCWNNFNDDAWHYVNNAICFKSEMDQQTLVEFLNKD
jgi:hypothetical protein